MDTTKTPAPTAPEADSPADLKKADTTGETTAPVADGTAVTGLTDEEILDEELDSDLDDELDATADAERGNGVGAAASAIVAAGLGLVALSGSWVSRVVAERSTLIGQIDSANSNATSTEAKIEALYGNAWQMTALVNGVLSTIALLIAVFVLALPAFGAPGRTLPTWVRAVSWAAMAIGALGVIVFGVMYFLPLPKAA
ncbi:hypothetical protein J7F03_32360 [Streptomyces sp. ISL-43]|uniref:hypothetical protein n=1 Tax=Streptomyces sp. ISL-43 TaxID=2819183 RepID=UPI001BE83F21|nr:hypothetical protein [Streptomyces sp. ISL-43]MBT2451672.1 hypothetical protein [Streptomyces sp. ISL-43]